MKRLSIFLIFLLVLSCSSSTKKAASSKTKTGETTAVQAPKVTGPIREGQYYPETNVFVYKKDRLIIKDKLINYTIVDETEGLLDVVTQKMKDRYNLQSYEYFNLTIQGEIKDNVFYAKKIVNYRGPEDRLENTDDIILED